MDLVALAGEGLPIDCDGCLEESMGRERFGLRCELFLIFLASNLLSSFQHSISEEDTCGVLHHLLIQDCRDGVRPLL